MCAQHSEALNNSYPMLATSAMVLNPAGQVLLLESKKWQGLLGFPGGKVNYGERVEDALLREIKEETGLSVYGLKFLITQELISEKEFIDERHFVSLNYIGHSNTDQVTLNHEASDYIWCMPHEALNHSLNRPTREMIQRYLQTAKQQDMDTVAIDDLQINCIVGIHDWERKNEQPVSISVELYFSTELSAIEGDLTKTADYSAIALAIQENVQVTQYALLETMAENLAQMILRDYGFIQGIKIAIKKPRAILGAQAARVSITRYR